MIQVCWQDENGNPLLIYDGPDVDERLPSHATPGSRCLRFIDLYGDTTFNSEQVRVLAEELSELGLSRIDSEVVAQAQALFYFIKKMPHTTHRYLKFIGD